MTPYAVHHGDSFELFSVPISERIELNRNILRPFSAGHDNHSDVFIEQLGAYLAGRKLRLEISA